jgi:hypothetical protein
VDDCGAGGFASRAGTSADDRAASAFGDPVVGGLALFMIELILGDRHAFLKPTKIAHQSIPFTNHASVTMTAGTMGGHGKCSFPFAQQTACADQQLTLRLVDCLAASAYNQYAVLPYSSVVDWRNDK